MKKTDYTNAQFDDAELRVKELFDAIQQESSQGLDGADVAVDQGYGLRTYGHVLIYKKGDTVYLRAVCLAGPGVYLSDSDMFKPKYRWGLPPQQYRAQDSSNNSFVVESIVDMIEGRVVYAYFFKNDYSNPQPIGPMVIKASWQV